MINTFTHTLISHDLDAASKKVTPDPAMSQKDDVTIYGYYYSMLRNHYRELFEIIYNLIDLFQIILI